MSGLVARWQALWLEEVDPRPLALLRILLGAYVLVAFARLAPHVTLAFSDAGVPTPHGPVWVPPPGVAWALYLALLAAALLFALGAWTRIAGPALLALFLHHHLVYLAMGFSAFDQLLAVLLGLVAFAPVDARWALRGRARERVPAWPTRLVLVELVALYWGAAAWKVQMPAWRSGLVVRDALRGMWATDAGFWLVQRDLSPATWDALAHGTIAFELLLPVLLLVRRARPVGVALGVAFHAAMALFLHVPEFLLCVVAYAALWTPPTRSPATGGARSPDRP